MALRSSLRPFGHAGITRSTKIASVRPSAWIHTVSAERVEGDESKRDSQTESIETLRRKRRTEWKRRQGGQTFLDHAIIHIRAGKGGDGCVAFHREKYKPYGPPSGGNGGRGADVYIQATSSLTTLASVPTRVRGEAGGTGQGLWQNGRNAQPYIIRVPLGTIVRELGRDDPRRTKDEYEAEAEALEGLEGEERIRAMRARRWVHYPSSEDDNLERSAFREAERALYQRERQRRAAWRLRMSQPIYLDLTSPDEVKERDVNAPLGLRRHEPPGHLIAAGGYGGAGNPHFLSADNRSPKFASRGHDGERISLSLELKLLADVGLVGMPNAGKSTLLRALSGGRAKTEVAGYAFTTLNPVVAVIQVAEDGSFTGTDGAVYDETWVEEQYEKELLESGALADARTRNQRTEGESAQDDLYGPLEAFRFTVADNPGLIEEASADIGLGHSFLRSIERSLALAYVVDLSAPAPWDDLRVLRDEIEKYKPGISPKARLVLANKADLLGGGEEDPEAVQEAKEKLKKLEEFVAQDMAVQVQDAEGNVIGERQLDVVPISAKYSLNLRKVVHLMRDYVAEARKSVST
ncbi:GTP-binding protein Obg/CgtA [Wolfiporia cocos MD-104 SS10]|uniref:GTP-binding protein Obg/CgtA n=1 Tax=Wolfiporia cocos (strain MD-104) TaxID=742152 RepID=A0A2H3J5G5_WOLCO|nr:GTP-binding protein Obg/CgtA [Wolfiporia cocos MD-104 SS10]